MPQLLLEFISEEMPARMQTRAAADLERLLTERLSTEGFPPESVKAYVSPRRLAVVAQGVAAVSAPVREEKKGPRVGAPEGAIAGFLRSAGLASLDEAEVIEDKKGAFYVAVARRPGRRAQEVIGLVVADLVRGFPWPKSMRWGEGDLRWVRPLHRIVCLFDGAVAPVALDGICVGDETVGHRFHAPGLIRVSDFASYKARLGEARVMIDAADRKARILETARGVCAARGLELVEDMGLLDETAGLTEWPVVVIGDMDPAFLDLPGEVIRLTMRTHQKYFAVRDPKSGRLAPHFVTVANIEAADGGRAIAAGNARVLSARLNDARYFWDLDRRTPLEARVARLDRIVFHQRLGSVGDKVRRIETLAARLAPLVGSDADLARRAARLAKADLVTETVGEFPELQGQIGRQLGELEGLDGALAAAIEDHYRPQGPNDRTPGDPLAACVALADKLDSLAGFWAIGEKPSGSSDPYALRRAALGVVRIILEHGLRIALTGGAAPHGANRQARGVLAWAIEAYQGAPCEAGPALADARDVDGLVANLFGFLTDRLRIQLRDVGRRHDTIDAILALGDDDLVRVVARIESLERFLAASDGINLLAGYRRAANILKAEEKKEPGLAQRLRAAPRGGDADAPPAQCELTAALAGAKETAGAALAREAFEDAMAALAALRPAVDRFFIEVMVNDDDPAVRFNRLALLSDLRAVLHQAADFSKLEG
jgi:glycyl-tRNA synthetase beta chain